MHRAGASALDKKARKRFDSVMLQDLGAKPQKGPRIPASIGLGGSMREHAQLASPPASERAGLLGT
jgi:hypothetical protein